MQGTIIYLGMNGQGKRGKLMPNHHSGVEVAFNEESLAKGVVWEDLKVNLTVTYSLHPGRPLARCTGVRPVTKPLSAE